MTDNTSPSEMFARAAMVLEADLAAEQAAHAETRRERDLLAGLLEQGHAFRLPDGTTVFGFIDDNDVTRWELGSGDTGFPTAIEAIRYAMKQEPGK